MAAVVEDEPHPISGEGVRERFDRLVRAFGAAVSRTARSYAASGAEREDLEQDIAVAIWRGLPSFRGDCSERTFVLRIAHNQALSSVTRRRSRLSTTELDEDPPNMQPDPE